MNTRIEKEIGYAYASSLTAKRCGFYQTGCYYVSLLGEGLKRNERLVQGFETKWEAIEHADRLFAGIPYSRWSLRKNN